MDAFGDRDSKLHIFLTNKMQIALGKFKDVFNFDVLFQKITSALPVLLSYYISYLLINIVLDYQFILILLKAMSG